jgi:hypothetical protein
MTDPQMTLLLISGSVGVGKTTVANELSTVLEGRGIPHTFMDLDALAYTFPRDPDDPFGDRLATQNLKAVWRNCRAYGSKNLIIARIVESRDYAAHLSRAVGIERPIVCELRASPDSLIGRVRAREVGSNLDWHERRSLTLSKELNARNLADFIVDTDRRSVTEIAREIDDSVSWTV